MPEAGWVTQPWEGDQFRRRVLKYQKSSESPYTLAHQFYFTEYSPEENQTNAWWKEKCIYETIMDWLNKI